jgi:hypothetical protein
MGTSLTHLLPFPWMSALIITIRPWHFDEINLLMAEKAKGLSELRRTDPLNIQ